MLPEITGGSGGNSKGGLSTAHRNVDLDRRQGRKMYLQLAQRSNLAAPLTAAECLKGSPYGANEERGLAVSGMGNSHMQYNSDGRYIREAACFVYRSFVASQKSSS
jgi:hypothetical protein